MRKSLLFSAILGFKTLEDRARRRYHRQAGFAAPHFSKSKRGALAAGAPSGPQLAKGFPTPHWGCQAQPRPTWHALYCSSNTVLFLLLAVPQRSNDNNTLKCLPLKQLRSKAMRCSASRRKTAISNEAIKQNVCYVFVMIFKVYSTIITFSRLGKAEKSIRLSSVLHCVYTMKDNQQWRMPEIMQRENHQQSPTGVFRRMNHS